MSSITERLLQAGIENAAQEAKWLVQYGGEPHIDEIVRRRIDGEPLQYLLGEWEFYGHPFKVGPGVLIPRPETELLVDLGAQYKNADFFDLCAGCGCVGIALAKETKGNVIAVEKSPDAVKYLQRNVALNDVRKQVKIFNEDIFSPHLITLVSRVLSMITTKSVVLINPPYLSTDEILNLQKEVRKEPTAALYGGGDDGLDFYRRFFAEWRQNLNMVDVLACEVGDGRADAVCKLMEEIGLTPRVARDYNKVDRVVYTTK